MLHYSPLKGVAFNMNDHGDEDKSLRISQQSAKALADYFLAVSHPKRILILSLLAAENMDFADLLETTDIRKTALSNQLNRLVEKRLIQIVSH